MYILSRHSGEGDWACEKCRISLQPGPIQPCSMQRKGIYGRTRRVEAQLGQGRAWWSPFCLVLLTQCGWMLRVSPHHVAAKERSAPFCRSVVCKCLLQPASLVQLLRYSLAFQCRPFRGRGPCALVDAASGFV